MNLTIVASNRNRLMPHEQASQWFVKSLQWQDYEEDFELLIADGGSDNYNEIEKWFKDYGGKFPMRIVQHKIGEPFERALLNNVGVRNAKAEYVMTTDVDMMFGKSFVKTLMGNAGRDVMVESRTMYWKQPMVNCITKKEKDLYNNIDECKIGRIKKRSSAGGCQCLHKDGWTKLRGFNEAYVGWGSEDSDLLQRAQMAGFKIVWLGESMESIMLFHQYHAKSNEQVKTDLEHQENNKKLLNDIRGYKVNPKGWGGIYE